MLVTWGLSEIFEFAQIVVSLFYSKSGYGAITTGLGLLLSFGPVGWVAGGLLVIAGAGAVIIGASLRLLMELQAEIIFKNMDWMG